MTSRFWARSVQMIDRGIIGRLMKSQQAKPRAAVALARYNGPWPGLMLVCSAASWPAPRNGRPLSTLRMISAR